LFAAEPGLQEYAEPFQCARGAPQLGRAEFFDGTAPGLGTEPAAPFDKRSPLPVRATLFSRRDVRDCPVWTQPRWRAAAICRLTAAFVNPGRSAIACWDMVPDSRSASRSRMGIAKTVMTDIMAS